ncbi:Aste57867_24964 [Aphanomyces stellatus]|uniref:Aste57867_24964 protein n=1 Tax=Aphanomyces stellatus TaxID=120398 RepID=A0A485LRV0_9STRA|nr:hypothetical protein As57867_024886 [Aphanomyces stellatus]VFU01595.1 Aste57867_24964 [Aphanomyces stellatus]
MSKYRPESGIAIVGMPMKAAHVWHWQSRERRGSISTPWNDMMDLTGQDEVPLRQLQCAKVFDAWCAAKAKQQRLVKTAPPIQDESETKDPQEVEERFQAWLKAKLKTRRPPPTVPTETHPPFKPRPPHAAKTKTTPSKAPVQTQEKATDSKKAQAAYGAWLEKKKAERRVLKQQAKAAREAEESARRQLHVDTWRKKPIVLAYVGLQQPKQH